MCTWEQLLDIHIRTEKSLLLCYKLKVCFKKWHQVNPLNEFIGLECLSQMDIFQQSITQANNDFLTQRPIRYLKHFVTL